MRLHLVRLNMSEVRACCAERAEASMARQLVQLLHRHGVAETRGKSRLFSSLKTRKGVRRSCPLCQLRIGPARNDLAWFGRSTRDIPSTVILC